MAKLSHALVAAFIVIISITSYVVNYKSIESTWIEKYQSSNDARDLLSTASYGGGVLTTTTAVNVLQPNALLSETIDLPKITNTSSPKLHVCTCLTPDHPSTQQHLPETPKRIRWLHFPKTGTSFISTLWSYSCSTRERYIDLEISSYQCDVYSNFSYSMYDFALMK